MNINELTKEVNLENNIKLTNKDVIDFLKSKDFKVTSHMAKATDEMIDLVKGELVPKTIAITPVVEEKQVDETINNSTKNIEDEIPETKTFAMDDLIPCRSVTPWELNAVGADRRTVYHWSGFGDVDYIKYSDLQNLRRKDLIKAPKVIIEDASLCYQWRRELGDTYKYYLGVEYPEDFFELNDTKFEELLKKTPDVLKEVIKTTAINMIKNENYPSVQKITLIDNVLGTCLKEFL